MFRAVLLLISAVVLSASAQIFVHQPVVSVAKTFAYWQTHRRRFSSSSFLRLTSLLNLLSLILNSFIQLSLRRNNGNRNCHQNFKNQHDSIIIQKLQLALLPRVGSAIPSIQCSVARPIRLTEAKSRKSSTTRDSWRRSRGEWRKIGSRVLCVPVITIEWFSFSDWKYIAETFIFCYLFSTLKNVFDFLSSGLLHFKLPGNCSWFHLYALIFLSPPLPTLIILNGSERINIIDGERKNIKLPLKVPRWLCDPL